MPDPSEQVQTETPLAAPVRFVVAGCSRSGTTYMAQLMSALGYECGHERIFNICRVYKMWDLSEPLAAFYEKESKQGDASFLSIPYLDQLPKGTVVLHQVRDPLAVVRSHMGIRFFAQPWVPSIYLADEHLEIMEFLQKHCAEIFESDTEIGRCMRYWYYWNRLVERAADLPGLVYLRYQVEDINAQLVQVILEKLGSTKTERECQQVLDSIPTSTNTRPRDNDWTWDTLPAGQDKDQVSDLAKIYGYL